MEPKNQFLKADPPLYPARYQSLLTPFASLEKKTTTFKTNTLLELFGNANANRDNISTPTKKCWLSNNYILNDWQIRLISSNEQT
jgi:hypothetical protein